MVAQCTFFPPNPSIFRVISHHVVKASRLVATANSEVRPSRFAATKSRGVSHVVFSHASSGILSRRALNVVTFSASSRVSRMSSSDGTLSDVELSTFWAQFEDHSLNSRKKINFQPKILLQVGKHCRNPASLHEFTMVNYVRQESFLDKWIRLRTSAQSSIELASGPVSIFAFFLFKLSSRKRKKELKKKRKRTKKENK